jgi:hypothetical protein
LATPGTSQVLRVGLWIKVVTVRQQYSVLRRTCRFVFINLMAIAALPDGCKLVSDAWSIGFDRAIFDLHVLSCSFGSTLHSLDMHQLFDTDYRS